MKDISINKVFLKALVTSSPIFVAYFPLGVVFGLFLENQGYFWLLGPIMSLLVYAGAVQFLALSLVEQGSTIPEILVACLFVAIRNAFYGPAFFQRFSKFSFFARSYLAFSLVDATYGLLLKPSPVNKESDQKYCLYLSIFIHLYWVLGTVVGSFAGSEIPHVQGLEFVLTILFAILTLDQYYKLRKIWPFMVGIFGWSIMLFIAPNHAFLGGIIFSVIVFSIMLRKA